MRLLFVCLFASLGVINPFFPIYLQGLGLSGVTMSVFFAIGPLMQAGVPLAWGWYADRSGGPIRVVRVVAFGAFLFMLALVGVQSVPALLALYALHLLFAVALPGMADAIAVNGSRRGDDYGRIRAWGSISFAAVSALVGPLLAHRNVAGADRLIPAIQAVLLGATFLATLRLEAGPQQARARRVDWAILLRDRRLHLLFASALIHAICSAPYRGFLSVLLRDRGISLTVVGEVFTLGVVAETIALWQFERFRRRFSLRHLLALAFAFASLRSLLTASAGSALVIAALQLLHAFTFGVYWAASVRWLRSCVPPSLQATGQMLFACLTLGAGTVVGNLTTGYVYDLFHSAAPAFAAAGLLELLALLLMLAAGRRLEPVEEQRPLRVQFG